ncbi:MAG: PLP-dependent aspartate aminotransferase family protein [Planctomycetota bacterium]
MERPSGFGTRAIHAGQSPDPTTGAIMTPIYQTSTYVQESPGQIKGYDYSRGLNPTRDALQKNLAALENGKHGLCFASGMAAINCVLNLLQSGDHVVAGNDLYGGTYRLCQTLYTKFGVEFSFIDMADLDAVRAAFRPNTKLLMVESPSNPLLKLADFAALTEICKEKGVLSMADNTFGTPYVQTPLDHGFDIVMHSTTKYLGGHSDVVGGALICNDDELNDQLAHFHNTVGGTNGPFDAFLVLRGTKTLHVRMERHAENALQIARALEAHGKVTKVYYPGLESHAQFAIAEKQMRNGGGMVSFEVDASVEDAMKVASSFKVFSLAESLGGVESLVDHPVSMTHGAIPREERIKAGFQDGLIRLSVGIEDIEDLLEDVERGLSTLG